MSMMHFEPFRSLRDLDRLTNQLLSGTQVPLGMPMDVWREGQTYHVALDLPGVAAEDIDLRVERNTLTVSAQRQTPFGAGQQGQGGEALTLAQADGAGVEAQQSTACEVRPAVQTYEAVAAADNDAAAGLEMSVWAAATQE